MPFVWGIVTKAIGVVAVVVAVFVVAWYFYIHDHAARTSGGIAASLQRVLDADEMECRERRGQWRCTGMTRSSPERWTVVKDGRKNCWRVPDSTINGCVKVTDYVAGLL